MSLRQAAAVLCALLTTSCSATIYRRSKVPLEEVIESSDEGSLVIRKEHVRYRVPREQVAEIDHPGNVAMVLGGISLGIGVPLAAVGVNTREPEMRVAGITYGLLGLALLIAGAIPWTQSRMAAANFEGAWEEPDPLPIACDPEARSSGCPELAADEK